MKPKTEGERLPGKYDETRRALFGTALLQDALEGRCTEDFSINSITNSLSHILADLNALVSRAVNDEVKEKCAGGGHFAKLRHLHQILRGALQAAARRNSLMPQM